MASLLGWCNDGHHKTCKRSIVLRHSGETLHCACTHPGCPCADWNKENPSDAT